MTSAATAARPVVTPAAGDVVTWTGTGFAVNGSPCRSLTLHDAGDDEWRNRQHLSLDSYEVQHVSGEIDSDSIGAYQLFGSYIDSAAFRSGAARPLVLDVGCGIFPRPSPAIERLDPRCQYVGLDPLPRNLERAYPFICGRLEDLAALPGFALKFDLFVFGTSIDHLQDLAAAAAAVRRLAAPGALLVCWNGLHEPARMVANNGVAVFRRLVSYRSLPAALAAFAGYGLLRLPRLLLRMQRQGRAVRAGAVLDHHYRWFTEQNTAALLAPFGEVVDMVTLPNTNHGFATVRIGAGR